ncbi:NAD(P)-binding protein [Trichoderma evansii]
MVTVAVAGGGSAIASNIINVILASKKHQLVILSRSPRPDLETEGAVVKVVDYENHEQLTKALQGVHTVLSCIWSYGPAIATSQLALLEAAKAAKAKRFVPSEWAVPAYNKVAYYKVKEGVWDAVKKSGLEYTRFINGLWLNIWAADAPREEDIGRAGYRGPPLIIDIKAGTASIPGDGSSKIAFTDMRDIGKYVTAALDFEKWDEDSVIVGEKLSINEFVEKVERITGKTIEKTYISLEGLAVLIEENKDPMMLMVHEFLKLIGEGDIDLTATINQKVPGVKPTKVEDFLARHWGTA